MWPYFGKKPFLPTENEITHVSMDYLLKSEWFHWFSALVLRPAEPCAVIWETKQPIFYIFVCKKGAAESLLPYRLTQASDWGFLVFLMVWVQLLLFLELLPQIICSTSFQPTYWKKAREIPGTLSNINKNIIKKKRVSVFLFIVEN